MNRRRTHALILAIVAALSAWLGAEVDGDTPSPTPACECPAEGTGETP